MPNTDIQPIQIESMVRLDSRQRTSTAGCQHQLLTSAALGERGKGINAVALGTYSKLRARKKKNLALMPIMGMEPFAGFFYPSFLLIRSNAQSPNAAKLFVEYLLTEEGFSPWSGSLGTYSSNPNIRQYPGDNSLDIWSRILVFESPSIFLNIAPMLRSSGTV